MIDETPVPHSINIKDQEEFRYTFLSWRHHEGHEQKHTGLGFPVSGTSMSCMRFIDAWILTSRRPDSIIQKEKNTFHANNGRLLHMWLLTERHAVDYVSMGGSSRSLYGLLRRPGSMKHSSF